MSARILLVDDDPNILDTGKDILEDAGFQVATAGAVSAALQSLQQVACRVMIADLNLPDGSGLDLATQARARYPDLRIVLMTGESQDVRPAGAPAQQANVVDDYLLKPVHPQQLLKVIQRLLQH